MAVPVVLFQSQTNFLNPWDEASHFDYVYKLAALHELPVAHEPLSDLAADQYICSVRPRPDCWRESDSPRGMESNITAYLPTYYLSTALVTWAIHALPGDVSWLDSAQLSSLLWLVALVALVVLVGRELNVPQVIAVAAAVVVGVMPIIIVQASSVTNDLAASVFAMASVWAWLALRRRTTMTRLTLSGLLALAAATSKESGAVAILVVAFMEYEQRVLKGRREGGSLTLPLEQEYPYGDLGTENLEHMNSGERRAPEENSRAIPVSLPSRFQGRIHLRSVFVPTLFSAAVLFGYLFARILDREMRGAVPPTGFLDNLIASTYPQTMSAALAVAYSSIVDSLLVPQTFPGFAGAWLQVGARWAAMAAVGGIIILSVRAVLVTEPGLVALPRGVFAFFLLFPPALLIVLKATGPVIFWQPRYYLPGIVLALVLALFQWHLAAGRVVMVVAFALWVFTVREMASIDQHGLTQSTAGVGSLQVGDLGTRVTLEKPSDQGMPIASASHSA